MNTICEMTGKMAMTRSDALRKVKELAATDPDGGLLNAYRCAHCNRHHVGHRRLTTDTRPMRRLNQWQEAS